MSNAPIFGIKSIIGHNPAVPVLNLTTDARYTTIAYASGHLAAIYNCHTKETEHFQCHAKEIIGLLCDAIGRFFVTIDSDCCTIWDQHSRQTVDAVRCIRISHRSSTDQTSIVCAALSCDAKYLIIATAKTIYFWIWCTFVDRPNAQYSFADTTYEIRTIRIHAMYTDYFVCTLKDRLVFFEWKDGRLEVHTPVHEARQLIDSTFLDNTSRMCYSITGRGNGVIWSDATEASAYFSVSNMCYFKKMEIVTNTQSIVSIQSADELLLITFDDGIIRFYCNQFRIRYELDTFRTDLLLSISYDCCPRKYRFCSDAADEHPYEYGYVDELDGCEVYLREAVPTQTTRLQQPFMVRKFVVTTQSGKCVDCDLVRNTFRTIGFVSSDKIETFALHPMLPLVCAGGQCGRIVLYDYEENVTIVDKNMTNYHRDALSMPTTDSQTSVDQMTHEVTALAYTTNCHHLLCAAGQGFLYMLDPITLDLINARTIRFSFRSICDIVFSANNTLMAYYDNAMVIILCRFKDGKWQMVGKHLAHLLPIVYLNFVCDDTKLISCSEDRHCAVYDVVASIEHGSTLTLLEFFRMEQTVQMNVGIPFGDSGVLTATTKYDFRLLDFRSSAMYVSQVTRAHSLDGYIAGMQLIGSADSNECDGQSFLVFHTMTQMMGIQLLPLDGNPFKTKVMIGHPRSISKLAVLNDGKTIITLGEGDANLCIWSINLKPVTDSYKAGGTGLKPFCTLIPGGSYGWLFKEMQDIYCYLKIFHNTDREMSDLLLNNDLSMLAIGDFMRAIGYFISASSELSILIELTENQIELAAHRTVPFDTLVKLYLNYRSPKGFQFETVEAAFLRCARIGMNGSETFVAQPVREMLLDRDHLMHILSTNGQPMSRLEIAKYLNILMTDDDIDNLDGRSEASLLAKIPELFNLKEAMEHLMGLELTADGTYKYISCVDPSMINPMLANYKPNDNGDRS